MKKKGLLLLTIFFSFCLGFTSCSDDDDNGNGGRIEDDVFGVYKGSLDAEVVGEGLPGLGDLLKDIPQKVYLDKVSDNKVKFTIKDFAVGPFDLGTIEIKSADIEKKGSDYIINGTENLDLNIVGTCKVDLTGTVKGNNITLYIEVEVIAGDLKGLKVNVDFKGTKINVESEAEILEITFDPKLAEENALVRSVEETEDGFSIILFNEEIAEEQKAKLTPTITISEGATIEPKSGVAQDFNKEVVYTVTSKDGTIQKYTVRIAKETSFFFGFEEWESKGEGIAKHNRPLPSDILASSVEGASLLGLFGWEGGFPVEKTTDAKFGNHAIKLITLDTHKLGNPLVPALTSGSVFTGTFNLGPAMKGDQLSCTKFGVSYDKKPLNFRGWYKYTPGEVFIDGTDKNNVLFPKDKMDECAIQAVLYEAKDSEGKEVILTGHDINTSDKRVAVAVLADGTAKTEYTYFDIPFKYLEGKTYQEVGVDYKLAIVCSSSKEGDLFKGAGGSTLILDDLEVIGE